MARFLVKYKRPTKDGLKTISETTIVGLKLKHPDYDEIYLVKKKNCFNIRYVVKYKDVWDVCITKNFDGDSILNEFKIIKQ